jgi:aminoglycoside phosphotransferase family enzyme
LKPEQIQSIVEHNRFPGDRSSAELIETHVSWVILSSQFAFKIKKPVKTSFLDFSTIEQRAFVCAEEIRLNRRLAPEMYLRVLPIGLAEDGLPIIGDEGLEIIDHAVQMVRMDNSRQMDKVLMKEDVGMDQMQALAKLLSSFHKKVVILADEVRYDPDANKEHFKDLLSMRDICTAIFGQQAGTTLDLWELRVESFLKRHEPRFHQRAAQGFWVEGHGDLHTRNIFLLPNGPLVFDCIEFNPSFRRMDVLNELAFLCMDLEANGHDELAAHFVKSYLKYWPCMEEAEDEQLFLFFKAYRANVRLKVTLMAWEERPSDQLKAEARKYWDCLARYFN